jgi:putative aldouronate transport system permease protein
MATVQPAISNNSTRIKSLPSYRLQKRVLSTIIHLIMIAVAITMLVPFVLVISASLTDDNTLMIVGYKIIPAVFSLEAYRYLFMSPASLIRAYGVTTFVTLAGTFFGMLVMSMTAYAMSRLTGTTRKTLTFFVLFTVLFSGGLIPFYLVMTQLYHIKDSLFALIFPYLVAPFNVLLLRSFFNQLPTEILESAKIDGASELRIFFQIVIPLSTPALATIGLFTLLGYWNDYWLALLFIRNDKLSPLQYLLYNILNNALAFEKSPQVSHITPPTQALRMAMAVVAAGPAVFVSLGLGRYFVRGITLGALK